MSTYLFQEARIGNTVEIDGHLLMVKEQKGHCPDCFFFKRSSCSGIACTGYERTDGHAVYFQEFKPKSTK